MSERNAAVEFGFNLVKSAISRAPKMHPGGFSFSVYLQTGTHIGGTPDNLEEADIGAGFFTMNSGSQFIRFDAVAAVSVWEMK